uniref:C-factor n=1 Tax=Caenorhabditis tropicalis TaxID=1561998 RepID=A0A1I7U462_9PELO
MAPKTVFITGANRGIGLGIVRELLKNSEIEHLIAGARDIEKARELQSISQSDSRLHLISIDVSNDESLENSVKEIDSIVGENGLNLLINNAGMIEVYKTMDTPNRFAVLNCIDVNAVSSLLLSQHFLPLLRKAASHVEGDEFSVKRAAIVNIGSDCSSQTLNVTGFCNETLLAYKMSKVATLSFARSLVADFKILNIPILVTTIHPGWVLTDMGGPNAEITIEESASKIVNSLSLLNSSHNGGLFDRQLTPLPF